MRDVIVASDTIHWRNEQRTYPVLLTMTYREALSQYKEAYKVLHGLELTSVSMKKELFDAFLKELLSPTSGIAIISETFEVDGVTILKQPG